MAKPLITSAHLNVCVLKEALLIMLCKASCYSITFSELEFLHLQLNGITFCRYKKDAWYILGKMWKKKKSRTWAQRQNCLEKWLNDATGRKGSSVPQGIRIKALFSLLCIVRGEVWAVIKSKQKTVRLSLRSTDLFHKEALIAVVTVPYYASLAYCLCVQMSVCVDFFQVLLLQQLFWGACIFSLTIWQLVF